MLRYSPQLIESVAELREDDLRLDVPIEGVAPVAPHGVRVRLTAAALRLDFRAATRPLVLPEDSRMEVVERVVVDDHFAQNRDPAVRVIHVLSWKIGAGLEAWDCLANFGSHLRLKVENVRAIVFDTFVAERVA